MSQPFHLGELHESAARRPLANLGKATPAEPYATYRSPLVKNTHDR